MSRASLTGLASGPSAYEPLPMTSAKRGSAPSVLFLAPCPRSCAPDVGVGQQKHKPAATITSKRTEWSVVFIGVGAGDHPIKYPRSSRKYTDFKRPYRDDSA